MSFAYQQLDHEQMSAPIPGSRNIPSENNFRTITPVFQYVNLVDPVQSELQGKEVRVMLEVVRLRFAGDRYYEPVFKTDEMYRKVGNKIITYAERWADQYRAFLAGEAQIAEGTPLENLTTHGITAAQLSLCRALKIHSIEALYHLEGANLKSLGVHANDLKPMAKRWMEDRAKGSDQLQKIAELEAKLAKLETSLSVPVKETSQEEIDEAIAVADLSAKTSDELRAIIIEKTGTKPDGRLGHDALVNLVKGL